MWMITWVAMVGSRDRPREEALAAQGIYKGWGPEGAYREGLATWGYRALIGLLLLLRPGNR